MTVYDGDEKWLRDRINATTNRSSADIAKHIPANIRAHCFFSARVAEAHILERLRDVSDAYARGEIGIAEARGKLKTFLVSQGYRGDDIVNKKPPSGVDPDAWHAAKRISNLASTARINLILKQNAAMAQSAGAYQRGISPARMQRFPCWLYLASTAQSKREEHQQYVGRVYRKDDPIWRFIFPPNGFGCQCRVREVDATTAEQYGGIMESSESDLHIPPDSNGYSFDPAEPFKEFDLKSVKDAAWLGQIREDAEIEFGDRIKFSNNKKVQIEQKPYRNFEDENLPSAKEWDVAPAPARIDPVKARKRLEEGFEVKAGDGRAVVMDKAVLDHWEVEENKLDSDIQSRLSCLDYAVETLEHPIERWDQETQSRYLKVFQKTTGGYEGCMVVVTEDGKCRTYFLPSVSKVDKSRNGIGYEVIGKVELSSGRKATQTTGTIAAPDRSGDLDNKIAPDSGKVKNAAEKETDKQPEIQFRRTSLEEVMKTPQDKPPFVPAKTLDEAKKFAEKYIGDPSLIPASFKDLEVLNTVNELVYRNINELGLEKLPYLRIDKRKGVAASVIPGVSFNFNPAIWEKPEEWFDKAVTDYEKAGLLRFLAISKPEQFLQHTVDHEFGHLLLSRALIRQQEAGGFTEKKHFATGRMIRSFNLSPEETPLGKAVDFAFNKAKSTGDIKKISKYAGKNKGEFVSETFAMHRAGDKLPDYIENMIEELIK